MRTQHCQSQRRRWGGDGQTNQTLCCNKTAPPGWTTAGQTAVYRTQFVVICTAVSHLPVPVPVAGDTDVAAAAAAASAASAPAAAGGTASATARRFVRYPQSLIGGGGWCCDPPPSIRVPSPPTTLIRTWATCASSTSIACSSATSCIYEGGSVEKYNSGHDGCTRTTCTLLHTYMHACIHASYIYTHTEGVLVAFVATHSLKWVFASCNLGPYFVYGLSRPLLEVVKTAALSQENPLHIHHEGRPSWS